MNGPEPLAGHYGAILADPPWSFAVRSPKGEGRSAKRHYATMTLDQIKALPVGQWAAPDSALFLWVLDPMLPEGLDVMRAWGFAFKTVGFQWRKTNRDGSSFTGMGYWSRANVELCLLGVRGRPKRLAKNVRRLIEAPRREHSRKPDEVRASIERLVAGPFLEMFARSTAPGWHAWGLETDRFSEAA